MAVSTVYFDPPRGAEKWARWGLEARRNAPKSKKGGLSTRQAGRQGIGSGVARARDILAGKRLDARQVKAFFDRHEHNYEPAIKRAKLRAKKEGIPLKVAAEREPAVQSWWQWGGDPARKAAERAVEKAERASNPMVDRVIVSHRDAIGPEHKYAVVALDAQGNGLGRMDVTVLDDEAHVDWVEVLPQHRRQGIARALYHELYRWAKDEGLEVRHGWATPEGSATLEAVLPTLRSPQTNPQIGRLRRRLLRD